VGEGSRAAERPASTGAIPVQPSYDVIVVGLGAMGSAAAFHLARRRRRVLGLDAFSPGHTFGSSHGESRIIRQAYFEHPNYVPLLRRAYTLWEALQADAGVPLLHLAGGLFVGPADSPLVAGSLTSARQHAVPHELLDAAEIRRRVPVMRPRDDEVGLFEPGAGFLRPERCIEAHLRLARQAGADLRHDEPVRSWQALPDAVEVVTAAGRYRAARAVFTTGAWLGDLLAGPAAASGLRLPLRPERNVVTWLEPMTEREGFTPPRFPVFIWDDGPAGTYYGVPHVERPGVKVGRHGSGEWCKPETVRREVTPADVAPVRRFVARAMPDLDGVAAASSVCLYTNTPDMHFVIDRHPEWPQVAYAGGFSGHGFKFASVVGEILADLATTGRATPAADFLRASRLTGSG
jgi:sarcosine oxidase